MKLRGLTVERLDAMSPSKRGRMVAMIRKRYGRSWWESMLPLPAVPSKPSKRFGYGR